MNAKQLKLILKVKLSKLMADDKIIQFPKNRIVNDRTRELDAQRKKMGEKVAKQIQQQQ